MSIYDQDTDPSSPEARAAADASSPRPSPRAATTDPGVGPPPTPGAAVVRGQAVVVPPASRRGVPVSAAPPPARPKDSVELLLEGMAGPRPDRTKTMPQTSGEASAAYHAEHAVRAGQAPREDEPRKVLVDTVRVPVAKPLDEDALPLFDKLAARADPTYVVPARMVPRVVLAAVAGLAVVALIFIAFGRGQEAHPVSPAANAPPVLPSAAQPESALAVAPPAAAPLPAPAVPAATAEPSPGDSPAAMQAAPGSAPPSLASRPHSRHPGTASTDNKGSAAAAGTATGTQPSLGEFKTTF